MVGMSRQNYYKERKGRQRRRVDEQAICELVRRERCIQPKIGTRKLYRMYAKDLETMGIRIGRDRFFEVLRTNNLLIERRRSCRTTDSNHGFRKYSNLLKESEVTGSHQAWASDITYIRTEDKFMYLSLIHDVHSRKIVGWEVSDSLCVEGPLKALQKALRQLPQGARPIHHSDRGIQYCCRDYIRKLKRRKFKISMTEENHCYENAQAERLNGILKQEYSLGGTFGNAKQLRRAVAEAVLLYNVRRLHTSLDYLTPEQVHQAA